MANPITQYFKDTRGELNHVAWPTQKQTIVYTILVAALSLGVAAYLGAFDYLFTTLLTDLVGAAGNSSALQVTQPQATTTSQTSTGPTFSVTPNTTPTTNTTK
jgi:preprotein translocase SecE subunit